MISDQTLRALEQYFISDRDLTSTLALLPVDSSEAQFLKFIHILNTEGHLGLTKDKALVQAYKIFKEEYGYSEFCKTLVFREILMAYDAAKTEKERKEAFERLKTEGFVSWQDFDKFTKPTNMKKVVKKVQEESKHQHQQDHLSTDDDEEEDPEMKKYSSYFNYDETFNRAVLVDNMISESQPISIHPRYFPKLDYSKMCFDKEDERHHMFLNFLNTESHLPQIDFYGKNKSFKSSLNNYLKENEYQGQNLKTRFGVYDLLKLNKRYGRFQNANFAYEIVRRQYSQEFLEGRYKSYSFERKIQVLQDIEQFVERRIHFKFLDRPWFGNDSDIVRTIRFMQILLMHQNNIYDEKIFIDWLESPHTYHQYFAPKPKLLGIIPRQEYYSSQWNYYMTNLEPELEINDHNKISKIIEAYMQYFQITLKKNIIKKFEKKIRKETLEYLKTKNEYLNNISTMDYSTDLAKQVVEKFANATYIQLAHFNRSQFQVSETIEVSVEVKNIPSMIVKLFEINTDTYFSKQQQPFSSDINLDGLVAQIEIPCDYSQLPGNLRHIETFKFPQLTGKRGLYVIEFIGNGLTSRAVVQLGSLTLIHQSTIAGHFAFILNENNEPCKSDYTGMLFDGNFYQADKCTGRIVIPFGRHKYSAKAILVHQGFAQLADFERQDERYQFRAGVILHNESIVMGNLAKILIKPNLTFNDKFQADLRLLENTKIILKIVNEIDNITTSQVLEDVVLNDQQEYIIEFQVPSNVSSISVDITTSVNVVTKQTKQNFSIQETFKINNHSQDHTFCETFLRNVNGEYHYLIKGKNGEAISGVLVEFQMVYRYYHRKVERVLKSDKQGIIYLGSMKNIEQFSAKPMQSRIVPGEEKQWVLPKRYFMDYPNGQTLTFLDKETIKIPFHHDAIKLTNFQLLQFSRADPSVYIENHFDKAVLFKNPRSKFGVNYLHISGLQEGSYLLWLKKENVKISLNIFSGKHWRHSSDFILNERGIIASQTQPRLDSLRIDDLKITPIQVHNNGEMLNRSRIEVAIGGEFNPNNIRVHAWAYNLLPYDTKQGITDKLISNQSQAGSNMTMFPQWKNMYMNNRVLGDENRYIFERQQIKDKQAGIILEKPTVILKRHYIKDTSFLEEKLNEGTKYEKIEQEVQKVNELLTGQLLFGEMQCQNAKLELSEACDYSGGGGGFMKRSMKRRRKTTSYIHHFGYPFKTIEAWCGNHQLKRIEGFQNFLTQSAGIEVNVKLDRNSGLATFDMDLSPYTNLLITVVNENQCTQLVTPIGPKDFTPLQTRNLSLVKAFPSDQCFSELRKTQNLLRGESIVIEDVTSTTLQLIDSLPKVWQVIKDLTKSVDTQGLDLINIMLKWPSFKEEQKNKHYSEYCCHEFNIFLKLKDKEYFDKAVRPFISNKIEKTVVDYWLIDMKQGLEKYLEVQKLTELNTFEQCLMIQYLVSLDTEESRNRAQDLAEAIRDATVLPQQSILNRIFDQVLTMNQLQQPGKRNDFLSDLHSHIEDEKCLVDSSLLELSTPRGVMKKEKNSITTLKMHLNKKAVLFEDDESSSDEEASEDEMMDDGREDEPCRRKKDEECKESPKRQPSQPLNLLLKSGFKELQEMRQTQKLDFKELDQTKEYAETHYFKIKSRSEHKGLIKTNGFWSDLAMHLVNKGTGFKGFLTNSYTQSISSFNEVLLTIALTDLPFAEESHGFRSEQGRRVEIKAATNFIIYLKEIQLSKASLNRNLLVIQRYFEHQKLKDEVQEFLFNQAYICQVIITNISNQNLSFQALTQIPEGALPLYNTHFQKSQVFELNCFKTMEFQLYFYFPKTGIYRHFPTNISIDGEVVAKAQPFTFRVQRRQYNVNEEDIDDVIATGSAESVLNFMRTKNIVGGQDSVRFDMYQIYWLCKDPAFYREGIKILKSRGIFDRNFWSFSIMHNDKENIKEFFSHPSLNLKKLAGPDFTSSLLTVNSHEDTQDQFNFLDYYPIVNPRAHRVGGMDPSGINRSPQTQQWILNNELRKTYSSFMMHLTVKQAWTAHDRMMFVTYMFMQERVLEASKEFNKIKPSELRTDTYGNAQIQYDYIKAYLDFYQCGKMGSYEFKVAREISQRYKQYPVFHWQILFKEIAEQIKEIDEARNPGGQVIKPDDIQINNFEDTELERKKKQVMTEPQIEVQVNPHEKQIELDYINVKSVKISYYLVDLEVLFSKNPFISTSEDPQDFSFVQPYFQETFELNPLMTNQKLNIPEELKAKNLVIEVHAVEDNGIKKLKTYFSTNLKVIILDSLGELKVYDHEVPLPQAYIKVYSKKKGSGSVQFFKDGYTDLRGRFDYGQLSGVSIEDVEKFSIFIYHEGFGCLIKEAKPPSGISSI